MSKINLTVTNISTDNKTITCTQFVNFLERSVQLLLEKEYKCILDTVEEHSVDIEQKLSDTYILLDNCIDSLKLYFETFYKIMTSNETIEQLTHNFYQNREILLYQLMKGIEELNQIKDFLCGIYPNNFDDILHTKTTGEDYISSPSPFKKQYHELVELCNELCKQMQIMNEIAFVSEFDNGEIYERTYEECFHDLLFDIEQYGQYPYFNSKKQEVELRINILLEAINKRKGSSNNFQVIENIIKQISSRFNELIETLNKSSDPLIDVDAYEKLLSYTKRKMKTAPVQNDQLINATEELVQYARIINNKGNQSEQEDITNCFSKLMYLNSKFICNDAVGAQIWRKLTPFVSDVYPE